ncbi:hypothetical protein O3P69_020180 [Scylla paramamosain]|uniref:LIM zinc-binding domain-containing protein n=1 Tax=Scylla paramamosain TaxID=85552 RepID=A0AAW0TK63_SCYPA
MSQRLYTATCNIISAIDQRVNEEKCTVVKWIRRVSRKNDTCCSGSTSGGESSVDEYVSFHCRDQNEREDEELCPLKPLIRGGVYSFQGPAPPLLPFPRGWRGPLGRGSGRRRPVLGEQLLAADGSTAAPSCVALCMCTLAPSSPVPAPGMGGTPAHTKHYSTRQRAAETQIIHIVENKPKCKESCNKPNNKDSQQESENTVMQTSTTTNMPTKRFSFLMRSTSMKTETPAASERQSVTPSDQAILDKLATLSIQTPEAVIKPRVKCSLFTPPCARCGEPVYPQERVEPTLRLVYHNACFKCYHCGLRLTLKTFCRSPLDSKDTRMYCRSHVPVLDPGRVSVASDSTHAHHTLPRN